MEVSIPATMGGEKGMKMVVTVAGPVWIVKGAPGTQEYMSFYKNAVEKGWFFTDPPPGQGAARPGQSDGGDVSPDCRDRRHSLRDRR